MLGPAVHPGLLALRAEPETELGRDHHPIAHGRQRFTHELFVGVRPVRLSRIEERDATIHGRPNERDHLLLVGGRTVAVAHAHAAQAERRNFQATLSQFALLHCPSRLNAVQDSTSARAAGV